MAASTNGSLWRCAQEPLSRLLAAPATSATVSVLTGSRAASTSATSALTVPSAASHSRHEAASSAQEPKPYVSQPPSCILDVASTAGRHTANVDSPFQHLHTAGPLGLDSTLFMQRASLGSMLQITRGLKSKVTVEYHPMPEAAADDYSSEPTNYVQLLGALRHAASVDRLQHLVSAYGDKFDAVHVAAALTRLPKLATFKSEDLVAGVATLPPGKPIARLTGDLPAAPALPRMGARPQGSYLHRARGVAMQLVDVMCIPSGAVTVTAGGRTSDTDPELWRTAGTARTAAAAARAAAAVGKVPPTAGAPPVSRFYVRQSANTVWALGTLAAMGVELDWKRVAGALEQVLKRVGRNYNRDLVLDKRLTPADVAQLVKGLAQLGYAPRDTTLVPRLAAWSVEHAARFNARDVQMALHSFVALGYSDVRLVDALCTRAAGLGKDFPPAGIAAVLRSIAAATPTRSLGRMLADQRAPRHAALRALAAGIAPQLVLLSPQDLSTLSLALGRIGAAWDTALAGDVSALQSVPLPAWLARLADLLCDKAARDLAALQPTQVSAVLHMVAKLRLQHAGLLEAVADGILSEPKLDAQLNPMVGATVLHAFAPLVRTSLPTGVAKSAEGAVAAALQGKAVAAVARVKGVYAAPAGLKHASPSGIASLCSALVVLKDNNAQLASSLSERTRALLSDHWDPRKRVAAIEGGAAPAPLPAFTGEQLLQVLRGLRGLGALSPDELQANAVVAATYLERVLLAAPGKGVKDKAAAGEKEKEGTGEQEEEEEGWQLAPDTAIELLQEIWQVGGRNTGAANRVAARFEDASRPFLGVEALSSTASGLVPRSQTAAQAEAACGLGQVASLLAVCRQEGLLEGRRVLDSAAGQALAQVAAMKADGAGSGFDVSGAMRLLREFAVYASDVRPEQAAADAAAKPVPRTLTGSQVEAVRGLQEVLAPQVAGLSAGDREVAKQARELFGRVGGQGLLHPAFDAAVARA